MNSLFYLMRTGMKNALKELVRKPGKLVMYILLAALVAVMMLSSLFVQPGEDGPAPMYWMTGIYFAFIALFFVVAVQKGLTSGDTIFEMSDVNLLFVSPVNPRTILLYGLVRLAKTSFWAGFFILFQGANLARFGIGLGGVWVLFLVFILAAVAHSILSLVIYSVTNGRPRRKRLVRVLAVLVFVPLAVYLAAQVGGGAGYADALQNAAASPWLAGIPFVGWAAAGAMALISGSTAAGLGLLGLLVLACAGMVAYIVLSRADYYEDVLVATETAFERKRAVEEGDVNAAARAVKVRVGATGIGGRGASAFFYKHLRETFRQNRLGFFGVYTIIVFAATLAAAVLLRGQNGVDVVLFLQILMWMQIFMLGTGRGLKELSLHYIYMVPEPPFKKVVWSNLELVFKTLLESVLFFVVPGLVMGSGLLPIAGSVLVYASFSLLLLGINYLSMRWTGANLSAGLLLTLYFFAVVLIMLPGLVPALVVGFAVGGAWGTFIGLLILTGWQTLAAGVCFALSKGALHNCDMPAARRGG